jgi:hypothetical protein
VFVLPNLREDKTMVQPNSITDPQLIDFLSHKVNSFVKWDLVRFFHYNPHAIDTAENIAKSIVRTTAEIEPALAELTTSGVLRTRSMSRTTAEIAAAPTDTEALQNPSLPPQPQVYGLSKDPDMRELVARFLQACDDREFRMHAIYLVNGSQP